MALKKSLIIVGIILAIILIPIMMAVGTYNSLVQLDEDAMPNGHRKTN